MSERTEIVCDACGEDVQYTGNAEGYRLVLGNQSRAPWFVRDGLRGGAVTSMAVQPPIDRAHHFCGLPCLAFWMEPHREQHLAGYEKLIKHREWLKEKMTEATQLPDKEARE